MKNRYMTLLIILSLIFLKSQIPQTTYVEKIVKQDGVVGVNCDYTDIREAIREIEDNSKLKRYIIKVLNGTYDYSNSGNIGIALKNYVTIVGQSKNGVKIIKRDDIFAWEKATIDINTTENIEYTSIQNCTIISNNCKAPLHIDNPCFIGTFEGIDLNLINEQRLGSGDNPSDGYANTFAVGWRGKEHFKLINVISNGKLWGHNYNNTLSEGIFELRNCTSRTIQIGDLASNGQDLIILKNCNADIYEYLWFNEYIKVKSVKGSSFVVNAENNNIKRFINSNHSTV